MDVVRQNRSVVSQAYNFFISDREGWTLVYNSFEYPDESDKPRDAVKEYLWIQERTPSNLHHQKQPDDINYFQDTISRHFDGKVTRQFDELGYSPVIEKLKKDNSLIENIRKNLSNEARNLFDEGLEGYASKMS